MVNMATLSTLERLEREMGEAGRTEEQEALREARRALARPERCFLTTSEAAERLGVSIPTVKRWVERGTLVGGPVGSRWLVSTESVEHAIRLRQVLLDLDREGNPTVEEIRQLYARSRRARLGQNE
jgi:excisionase family DNA binding protein